uniref:NADH dehydrogenase subunit 4L n=1 Tax=Malaccina sinica TaxID=1928791 RepID=UPI00279C6CA4|nr:NADH dehydrogenase subunit 4L [Malaccina sinica]WGO57414.1 NADH dehydrogenase subunit 4L [Malaccina sinica]
MIYMMLLFICGVWVFSFNQNHLLITLLSLEFIVLSLYMIIFYFLNLCNFEVYFGLIFLTFSVCEGALGLSILVSMIRSYGNDYFQSYTMLQC